MTFTFNGNYRDREQVAPFMGDYARVRAEILAATGRGFVYNDELRGRIAGIANMAYRGYTSGTHEDSAIYMLQTTFRLWEQEARVLDRLAEGYEFIESVEGTPKFAHVILVPNGNMNGEWAEFRDARLVPEPRAQQAEITGAISAVLPKGKRTNGHYVNGRRVLVRRKA